MTNPMQDQLEQALADFERSQEALAGLQESLADSETKVTSKSGGLAVTVDGHGELLDIKFLTKAYRAMAPAELGNLLVETIREARGKAMDDATRLIQTVLPNGAPLLKSLGGSSDIDTVMNELAKLAAEPWRPAAADDGPAEEARR